LDAGLEAGFTEVARDDALVGAMMNELKPAVSFSFVYLFYFYHARDCGQYAPVANLCVVVLIPSFHLPLSVLASLLSIWLLQNCAVAQVTLSQLFISQTVFLAPFVADQSRFVSSFIICLSTCTVGNPYCQCVLGDLQVGVVVTPSADIGLLPVSWTTFGT